MVFKMKQIFQTVLLLILMAGWVQADDDPNQKFNGFNLQGYDEAGEKAWEVNGDTANIVGSEVILSNVDANTFGEQTMNVVAKTGIVDQTSGKMHLQEDVVITSEDGQQMMTDTLDWDRNKDLVTTEDDVLITGKQMMVTGEGLWSKPGSKLAKIHKDVTVVVDTESKEETAGKTVTITSDGPMVIDQAKSIATFEENVVAFQEDQTLKADRMEIYFDKEMSGIEKMVCVGNVEIEQGENKSYAQRAVYQATTQKLTLSGRPKLVLQTEGGSLFAASGN